MLYFVNNLNRGEINEKKKVKVICYLCDDELYLKTFRVNPMVIKKCIENYLYDKNVLKFIKKGSKKEKIFFKRKNSVKQGK